MSTLFTENTLTSDPFFWESMYQDAIRHPDLLVCSPTSGWVYQALLECKDLQNTPLPDIPTLVVMGTREDVVSQDQVKSLAERWYAAELVMIEGAKHELMIETKEMREAFYDRAKMLFDSVN